MTSPSKYAAHAARSGAESTARSAGTVARGALRANDLADLAEIVREAQKVAAKQRSVPLVPSEPMGPQAARVNIGNSASAALGDDIPRPAPATPPVVQDVIGMKLAPPGDLDTDLLRSLIAKYETQPRSLSIPELAYLVRAGADPDMLVSGPLSPRQADALLRRVAVEGMNLSPEEAAALRRTPSLSGQQDVGDLTHTDALLDNLEPSGVDLSPQRNPNLTPNTKKTTPVDALSSAIWQIKERADEPQSRKMLERLAREVGKYATVGEDGAISYDPEFLKAINYDRGGKEQLEILARLSGNQSIAPVPPQAPSVPKPERPASTAGERAAAAADMKAAKELLVETMPEGDWNALMEAFNALPEDRRNAALAALPSGRSLTPAPAGIRSLDPEIVHAPRERGDASFKLPSGQSHPMGVVPGPNDPLAAGPFVERLLNRDGEGPAFLPNAQAMLSQAGNPLEEAMLQVQVAKRSGDADAYKQAVQNAQMAENLSTPDEVSAAKRAVAARSSAWTALRNSIIQSDPLYREMQLAALDAATRTPPPVDVLPTGTRTPELPLDDLPDSEMPTQYDHALGVASDRESRIAQQARADGPFNEAKRREIAEASGLGEDKGGWPMWLRQDDNPAAPFYPQSRGDRAASLSSTDKLAIQQAEELKAAIGEAQQELAMAQLEVKLAQIGRTSANARTTAADVASAQENMARIQQTVRRLYDMEDDLFEPRVVDAKTGTLVYDSSGDALKPHADWIADPSSMPEQYRLERGYRGTPNSVLNKDSLLEIANRLNKSVAGFRPIDPRGLTRSSDTLSAAERQLQGKELRNTLLGDKAKQWENAVYPEGMEIPEDLPPGDTGKPHQPRNNRKMSQAQAALEHWFGGRDPFTMKDANGDPVVPRTREGAETLARDYLASNTDIKSDAAHQMSLEAWVRAIEDRYIGKPKTEEVAAAMKAADPAPRGTPPGDVSDRGTSLDVDALPALPGRQNAIDLPDPAYSVDFPGDLSDTDDLAAFPKRGARDSVVPSGRFDEAPEPEFTGNPNDVAVELKGKPRTPKARKDDAGVSASLDASDIEINDTTGASGTEGAARTKGGRGRGKTKPQPDIEATSGDAGLDKDTLREIEEQADDIYRRKRQEHLDLGDDEDAADQYASEAKQSYIEAEKKARAGKKKPATEPEKPVEGTSKAEGAGTPDAETPVTPEAEKPVAPDTATPADGASPGPTPTPEQKSLARTLAKWGVRGGLVGGAAYLSYKANTGGGMGGDIDIPVPPGGGGGVGGGGDFVPVPVGTDSSGGAMSDMDAETAIQRMLDRVRGSRGAPAPGYQTLQNYTMWR